MTSEEIQNAFADEVISECQNLAHTLIDKNRAYGNSALDPVRIFSKADPVEQLKVRLDDKISRLARGSEAGEDVILDLLGYLVLLRIAKARQRPPVPVTQPAPVSQPARPVIGQPGVRPPSKEIKPS